MGRGTSKVGGGRGAGGAGAGGGNQQQPAPNVGVQQVSGVSSTNLTDDQKNLILAMNNAVNADIQQELVSQGVRQSDAFSGVSDMGFNSDSTSVPGTVTAFVNVSQQASPSGLAKAIYRISYDFNIRTLSNGKQVPSYRGVKLQLVGVNPY